MKIKYFFRVCSEMVEERKILFQAGLIASRWGSVIDNEGNIKLGRTDDLFMEFPIEYLHPLCAVANEVIGFRPKGDSYDEWLAAEKISLSQEETVLLFVAALKKDGLDPLTEEVRQELVYNVSPKLLYEPPLNFLPWDKTIRVA